MYNNSKWQYYISLTKDKEIQTLVRHELVDQHFLILMNAVTKKTNEICVLEFCYEDELILELK